MNLQNCYVCPHFITEVILILSPDAMPCGIARGQNMPQYAVVYHSHDRRANVTLSIPHVVKFLYDVTWFK